MTTRASTAIIKVWNPDGCHIGLFTMMRNYPSKDCEPPVAADGSLFLAVKKLVPNLDQNPDNGDKPEHLLILIFN